MEMSALRGCLGERRLPDGSLFVGGVILTSNRVVGLVRRPESAVKSGGCWSRWAGAKGKPRRS